MKQKPFSLSASTRIYSPGWLYNLAVISVFFGGVGCLGLFLIPLTTGEKLPTDAYLFSIGGLFAVWMFMALMFLIISRFDAWEKRRAIHNITQGQDLLATWQYTAFEWQTLAEKQTASEKLGVYKWWHALITMLVMGVLFGYMASAMPPDFRIIFLPIAAFMMAFVLLLTAGGRICQRIISEQNHTRRKETLTPKLYISRKGLYHETEGLIQFRKLQDIKLEMTDEYPKLVLDARIKAGNTTIATSSSVPIPRQHLPDAQQLVEQFNHNN